MNNTIKHILESEDIFSYGLIPFQACVPANQRLYDSCKDRMKSVIVFAIPYKTCNVPTDSSNASLYARVYDYHKLFEYKFSSVKRKMYKAFPGFCFEAFADHSPINEKQAAASCGLGVIGKNTLLITDKYGSFVFIGSVITDMPIDYSLVTPKSCISCGRCISACPNNALSVNGFDFTKCLSFISQKRAKTADENALLKKYKTVWGCDICQSVCPMNEGKAITTESYFTDSFIFDFSKEFISSLSDEEFEKYPFSWRKKEVILHNIEAINS